MIEISEEEYLAHYGTPRHSGRYPWGSGDGDATRSRSFLDDVESMRKQGLSETDIAKGLGMSTTELRAHKSIAKNQQKQANIGMAQRLKDKGLSNGAIADRMGLKGESSVRALLEPGAKAKNDILTSTSEMLKGEVDAKTYVDVGSGVESHLGISKEKLNTALSVLKAQGYEVHKVKVQQIGTGFDTELKVLAPPGTTQKDVFLNRNNIKQIQATSDNGGETFGKTSHKPLIVHPDRVGIVYGKDGGADADGVIYVRPGVEDVSLGKSKYAQVRVQVGKDHYLKGMAMYKDDLPEGKDLLFNTNKENTGNKLDALKKVSSDPDFPFEAVVSQIVKDKGTKNERVTSAMNIVNEEGQWQHWSKTIASQVLSKQKPSLAREQLNVTYESRKREYDEIMSLTNPTVKKKLLEGFADGVDSASVHLEAARLPRQAWHVILPINNISPSEVYAPNYHDGERVALIRYPHGGTFEIPELTVNNRHPDAKKALGNAPDAIGIHPKVAERLSGADFDGDTVLVIPNNRGKIKSSPALEGLKGFDPKTSYPAYEGMPKLSSDRKQQLMGDVSNLITDMTIRQAPHSDIVRAVRHSMVVIDAEKHNLNYKQSALDNGIRQLKEQYQGGSKHGASTLISRAKSPVHINDRKPRPMSEGGPVDPKTGRKVFVDTGKMRTARDGTKVLKKIKSKKLAETTDAHTLSSGTPIEKIYADHSNKLKDLANQARLSALKTQGIKRNPSAAKVYGNEVKSLDAKLNLALRNAPLERQAQIVAANNVRARRAANPNLDGDSLKKIKYQALEEARIRTGAKKQRVKITPEEWNAIQAGAISNDKLSKILANADMDQVKELATPRAKVKMTSAKTAKAKDLLARGYTRAEVASQLGVALSTLDLATGPTKEG